MKRGRSRGVACPSAECCTSIHPLQFITFSSTLSFAMLAAFSRLAASTTSTTSATLVTSSLFPLPRWPPMLLLQPEAHMPCAYMFRCLYVRTYLCRSILFVISFPTELSSSSMSELGSSTGCSTDGCGTTTDVKTSSNEDDEPPWKKSRKWVWTRSATWQMWQKQSTRYI